MLSKGNDPQMALIQVSELLQFIYPDYPRLMFITIINDTPNLSRTNRYCFFIEAS